MALTNERAELLANYLTSDKERAKALLEISPEEAVKKINADGYDFTVDEVVEFGNELAKIAAEANESGELDESKLDNVSGGLVTAAAGVYLTCVSIGVTLGLVAGNRW